MNDELRTLWTLRSLDEDLGMFRASLTRFEAERRDVEARIAAERGRQQAAKQRVGELQIKRRQIERDVEALEVEERRFRSQLPSVKRNEEYTALLHEIENTKAKRSELETAVLVQLDEEERVQAEVPGIDRAIEAAEREGGERRARADREEAEIRGKIDELERRRKDAMSGLGQLLRSRYERVHASREGKAVVAIQKNACGGCFRQQPPQTLQEARRGDRVIVCDGCGRLLVWPPEGAPTAT